MIADSLSKCISLVARYDDEIADLEEILSRAKADRDHILEEDIPMILRSNGLASAPLADGRTVTVEQIVSVTTTDKDRLSAWLKYHGYDSVIRTEIDFGKGVDVDAVETFLSDSGIDYQKTDSVHPMTLKKVMREHIENGGIIPGEDVAKVHIYERAKIKEAK